MKEHTPDCICERCKLLDEITLLAKDMSKCIVPKWSGESILPQYWEKKERMNKLLKQLRHYQH